MPDGSEFCTVVPATEKAGCLNCVKVFPCQSVDEQSPSRGDDVALVHTMSLMNHCTTRGKPITDTHRVSCKHC